MEKWSVVLFLSTCQVWCAFLIVSTPTWMWDLLWVTSALYHWCGLLQSMVYELCWHCGVYLASIVSHAIGINCISFSWMFSNPLVQGLWCFDSDQWSMPLSSFNCGVVLFVSWVLRCCSCWGHSGGFCFLGCGENIHLTVVALPKVLMHLRFFGQRRSF